MSLVLREATSMSLHPRRAGAGPCCSPHLPAQGLLPQSLQLPHGPGVTETYLEGQCCQLFNIDYKALPGQQDCGRIEIVMF